MFHSLWQAAFGFAFPGLRDSASPGALGRGRAIQGVLESLMTGPEYTLPAAAFVNPLVAGGVAVAYVARFLFHPGYRFLGDPGIPLSPAEVVSTLAFDGDVTSAGYRRQ